VDDKASIGSDELITRNIERNDDQVSR